MTSWWVLLVVLYVIFLAGAFTGCATFWKTVWLRHHEPRPEPGRRMDDL